jgi:hypothetical protein
MSDLQGRCTGPFPLPDELGIDKFEPPLMSRKPGQCLIMLTNAAAIPTKSHALGGMQMEDVPTESVGQSRPSESLIWLDNVYIRSENMHGNTLHELEFAVRVRDRDIWMTNVTMQGNHLLGVGAIQVLGRLLAEGTLSCRWGRNVGIGSQGLLTQQFSNLFMASGILVICGGIVHFSPKEWPHDRAPPTFTAERRS